MATSALRDSAPNGIMASDRLFPAIAVAAGATTSVMLGVYARVHVATGEATPSLGFSDTLHFKVWATVLAVCLALVQLALGMWIFGRLPVRRTAPAWLGPLHRTVGSAALIVSLPVAYHCLWALGVDSDADLRVVAHGVAGCAFYGLFVAKTIVSRKVHRPPSALVVVASALLASLLVAAATSSGWFLFRVECCTF